MTYMTRKKKYLLSLVSEVKKGKKRAKLVGVATQRRGGNGQRRDFCVRQAVELTGKKKRHFKSFYQRYKKKKERREGASC